MRAAVITKLNTPWELHDLPDPKPAPGQVLIRIHASGMCGTDVHVHHGHLPCKLPIVAGHEPVGEVIEVGVGVSSISVGDRVGVHWAQKGCGRCRACQEGRAIYCASSESWMSLGGGNAELMLAWAEGCTRLPDGLAYETAAPVFCAGFTVMSGLRHAEPRPGERVAVLGIGGLGHLAVQYAVALGLETIVVTSTADKIKFAKELGASEAVIAGDNPGKALAGIGGVDVILSTTNSAKQLGKALSGLRPEGRLVSMGFVDGPISIVDQYTLLMKQTRIIGCSQNKRRDLIEAIDLVASGKVKPMIETYPLEEINRVFERVEAGKVRFRAVIQHARG